MVNECEEIVKQDDLTVKISTHDVSNGTVVEVACRLFANRLVEGSHTMVCHSGTWKPDVTPKCEFNGELNRYEQIVIFVSAGAAGLFVFALILIVVCGLRFRNKSKKQKVDNVSASTMSLHKRNDIIQNQDYRRNVNSGIQSKYKEHSHVEETNNSRPYNKKSDGYVFYTGQSRGDQYFDNKAYDPRSTGDFTDSVSRGSRPFIYVKDQKNKWDGHLPRPSINWDNYR